MRFYLRVSGEILITLGVLVFGFMAYMYWGTAVREHDAQRTFDSELGQQWSAGGESLAVLTSPGQLAPGRPFALIRIPAFGRKWSLPSFREPGYRSWRWRRGTCQVPHYPARSEISPWPATGSRRGIRSGACRA